MKSVSRMILAVSLTCASLLPAAVPEGHPRLFADREGFAALRQRLGTDPAVDAVAAVVKRNAERLLKQKPLQRRMHGRRLLRTCRDALQRISSLAMAYRLYGDRRVLERCALELKAVCAFSDWNPAHFLDVAEMSLAVATGYDWLYDELAPEDRETIAEALRIRGFEPCLVPKRARKGKPALPYCGVLRAATNWGQVCNCGAIAAALALRERLGAERTDAFVRQRAEDLKVPMAVYAPNGCYPEGPGYWNYGTDFNVLALAMLEAAYGTDWGLSELPGFRETGAFPARVCGPTGLFFNYSDSGLSRGSSISPWWFARRFGDPSLVAGWEFDRVLANAARPNKVGDRTYPYQLFWMRAPAADARVTLPPTWRSEGRSQLAVQRSGWGPDDFFFAIKGGTPRANHGHMDVGSFVLDADGVRWAWDLGAEDYTRIEEMGIGLWNMGQESERWTIFRLNNRGHNTVMVDGRPQRVTGMGRVVSLTEGTASDSLLDLTEVAADVCTNWVRGARLAADGRSLVLADALRGVRPGASVRWAMNTKAQVEVDGNVAHLAQAGRRMDLVQLGPQRGVWQVARAGTDDPRDSSNGDCRQVTFTCAAPADGEVRLRVRFERR